MPKRILWLTCSIGICSGFFGVPVSASASAGSPAAMAPTGDLQAFLIDPNLAFLLLAIAILGLAVEMITPGLIIPGSIGVIAAILAFLALSQLPVSGLGVTLFILALPLFVLGAFLAGAFIPLSIAGIAVLLAGSITLFQGGLRLHPALIVAVAVTMSAVIIFVANRVVKTQRLRITTGREGMVCQTAVVRTPLTPEGTVLAEGETWKAVLDEGSAQPGDKVIITCIQGLKLFVTKKGGE